MLLETPKWKQDTQSILRQTGLRLGCFRAAPSSGHCLQYGGCGRPFFSVLGNLDEAVQRAERAIDQRDPRVLGLKTTPLFENLRSHPSYPALPQRMNLA